MPISFVRRSAVADVRGEQADTGQDHGDDGTQSESLGLAQHTQVLAFNLLIKKRAPGRIGIAQAAP